jgi:uncharacterized membrane protein YphA (DoxX/SURF4 family)
MHSAIIVLSVLLGLAFLGSGATKLTGAKQSLQIRDALALKARLWTLVGGLEVAGGIGVLVGLTYPPLAIGAAAGLGLLMIGAVGAHLRAKDVGHSAPAVLLLVAAVALITVRFKSGVA